MALGGPALGIALAVLSALATAFAHAYLKAGADKLAVQAWVRLTELVIFLPIAIWIGLPQPQLWPWLITAAAIHALYQWTLIHSYRISDFSLAYPLARGASPLFTLILGYVLFADRPGAGAAVGIAILCVGVMTLVRAKGMTCAGLAAALGAGLLTTCYTLVDGHGMRIAGTSLSFLAWFFVADGISMPALLAIRDGKKAIRALANEVGVGIKAGLLALAAFVPALLAFRLAPLSTVAALREASVLIGLALSGAMLKERLDFRRAAGAALILVGAATIALRTARG